MLGKLAYLDMRLFKKIVAFQEEIKEAVVKKKFEVSLLEIDSELEKEVNEPIKKKWVIAN